MSFAGAALQTMIAAFQDHVATCDRTRHSMMSDVSAGAMSGQLNGAQPPAASFRISIDVVVNSSRDTIPYLFAGCGRMAQWMFEFIMAGRQMHHFDAVGVQAHVVDQPFCQPPRLRRVVRLDIDHTLEALEAMAVGIAEILVEGDAISVHLALPSFRHGAAAYSRSFMPASRQRLRSKI